MTQPTPEAKDFTLVARLIADFERAVLACERAIGLEQMTVAVAEYYRTRDALLKAMAE